MVAQITHQFKLFWTGLTIYVVSFVIPAVGGEAIRSGPAFGYHCAFYSLLLPPGQAISLVQGGAGATIMAPMEMLALFGSGMINVLFFAATVLILLKRPLRAQGILLKFVVISMLPLCWVVFHDEKLYPLLGYFMWTSGMLMVLLGGRYTVETSRSPVNN